MRCCRLVATLLLSPILVAGCAPDAGDERAATPITLGPADGRELPATDLERVVAGSVAPDFTLASLGGPNVTLSEFRGSRNVILVFYRGWW